MGENFSDFLREIAENLDTFIIIAALQIVLLILIMFLIVTDEKSNIS